MIERIRVLVARKRGPKKVIPAASTQSADFRSVCARYSKLTGSPDRRSVWVQRASRLD